jgi:hypothetical protein
MAPTPLQSVRLAGFALGVAATVFALAGWRVERGRPPAGTLVRVVAEAPGDLSVTGRAKVVAHDLAPGDSTSGTLVLANDRTSAADVHARAMGPAGETADALRIDVRSSGKSLYRGSLAGLANWTVPSVQVGPGLRARVHVRAWIPAAAPSSLAGQAVHVRLQFAAGHTGERGDR